VRQFAPSMSRPDLSAGISTCVKVMVRVCVAVSSSLIVQSTSWSLEDASRKFVFSNLETGMPVLIDGPEMYTHDWAERLVVCDPSSGLICFHAQQFGFAVPSSWKNGMSEWRYGDIQYCLIESYADRENTGSRTILVYSFGTSATSCDEQQAPVETKFVFSYRHGLRFIERLHGDGPQLRLFSLDRFGFGSAPRTERRQGRLQRPDIN
jgi:hypothetical protein